MVVCDRCGRPARPFAYGDYVNSSYTFVDLCYECSQELKDLIWNFRKTNVLRSDNVK